MKLNDQFLLLRAYEAVGLVRTRAMRRFLHCAKLRVSAWHGEGILVWAGGCLPKQNGVFPSGSTRSWLTQEF